jgi:hypothetical protein
MTRCALNPGSAGRQQDRRLRRAPRRLKIRGWKVITVILSLIHLGLPGPAQPQPGNIQRSAQVLLLANWLRSHRGADSGLPFSHVGDPRFKNWCFTYDAAVAALAWMALDQPREARRILGFYIRNKNFHRLGGVIEAVSAIPPNDGKDWSVRTGANLWLGLASYHLFKATGDATYLAFASQLADFALALQDRDVASPTYGGMRLGPPGDTTSKGDQHFGYDPLAPGFEQIFSTEACIDAFALFNMLQGEPGLERFKIGRDRCLEWLKKVAWNPAQHRFNRGFFREPDYSVASDIHAWGISALGVARLDAIEPGAAERMSRFVEENCQSMVVYHSPDRRVIIVKGFDFVDHGALNHLMRPPLVSPEWSFQMANAYKRLSDDFAAMGEKTKADRFAQKREKLLGQIMAMATTQGNAAGFPYATLADAPIGHEYHTPAQGSYSMIGAAYGILALTGYDPLRSPGGQQSSPPVDP